MNNACKLELIYMYMYLAIQKNIWILFFWTWYKKPTLLPVKEDSKNTNSKNIIHYLKLSHLWRQKQVYKVYI